MNAEKQLQMEAQRNQWSHAYLFVGKSSEILENALQEFLKQKAILKEDISTLSSTDESGKAGEIKIEAVKNLIHEINLSPNGKGRVAIIRNCERLNNNSANVLLKSIEEPPAKVTFILISESPSVLPTIKSRCRTYYFPSYPLENDEQAVEFFNNSFLNAGKIIDGVIKRGEAESLLEEIMAFLRKRLIQNKDKTTLEALKFTQRVKNDIKGNTSIKLAFECLWLKAKEING